MQPESTLSEKNEKRFKGASRRIRQLA